MKKRIIFDIDGTLLPKINFEKSIIQSFNDLNLPYNKEIIDSFIEGMSDYEKYFDRYTLKNYFNHLYNKTHGAITYEFVLNYLNNPQRLVPNEVSKEVYDVLEYLSLKYELVVLTNFFKEVQEKRLKQFDLAKYFLEIIGGDLFIKPDEKSFLAAKGKLNIDDCIYVGDNIDIDLLGAYNAGMDCVLVDYNSKNNISVLKRML